MVEPIVAGGQAESATIAARVWPIRSRPPAFRRALAAAVSCPPRVGRRQPRNWRERARWPATDAHFHLAMDSAVAMTTTATTAAAVAKKVFAGTSTSRPATPWARRMISSAAVPLLTDTA